MSRLPYAAKTLLAEAREVFGDIEMQPFDEPDGFNVSRTVRFDKDVSVRLGSLLNLIDDPRVHSVNRTDAGYLHVTFTSGPESDSREPFNLEDAQVVLGRDSTDSSEE